MSSRNDIERLLFPRSVAVIGASNTSGKPGEIIFRRLLESKAEVYPVNPSESEVLGIKSYPDIAAVPGVVDVAVITTGAELETKIAEDCAGRGVKHLIVIAGGFGETGPRGLDLENRLRQICREYGRGRRCGCVPYGAPCRIG